MATRTDSLRDLGEPPILSQSEAIQWGLIIAGGMLIGFGVVRGSLVGLLSTAAGAGVLYLGLTQQGQPRELGRRGDRELAEPRPPVQGDVVDQASWESFPASDSPAY